MADRFCGQCGTSTEGMKFCPGCGTAVAAPDSSNTPETGEEPHRSSITPTEAVPPTASSGPSSRQEGGSRGAEGGSSHRMGIGKDVRTEVIRSHAGPVPIYQQTWLIAILIILFFPVGLFLMWRYAAWSKTAKIAVSSIWALLALGVVLTPKEEEPDVAAVATTESSQLATTTLAPLATAAPTTAAPVTTVSPTTVPPRPTPLATAAPTQAAGGGGERRELPQVVGLDHQLAQDTMQAAGFYNLVEYDASGQNRSLVFDRNWKVCRQNPRGGTVVETTQPITLESVKDEEPCP